MPKTYNQGTQTNIISAIIALCLSGGILFFLLLFALLLHFTFACAIFSTTSKSFHLGR